MPDGVSTDKFIDVLNGLHTKIDNGFGGVYTRINDLSAKHADTLKGCNARFDVIESRMSCKNGANSVRSERRDFWKYIIRGVVLACAVGLLGGAWKLVEVYNTVLTLVNK